MTIIEIREETDPLKWANELTGIYTAAFAPPPYNKTERESGAFAFDFKNMVKRQSFRLVMAWELQEDGAERPVGFAFGYQILPDYGWNRVLGPAIREAGYGRWLDDVYCLSELALLPDFWGMGIGGRLHDKIFEDQPHAYFILSTMQNDTTNAYKMYLKRGWFNMVENYFVSSVDREYRVMGRERGR